eukprot:m.34006 g.34006  ORF g.34006 m.34006 type:complete len:422 (+) comp12979_c0_seq1:21-1286(+)
MMLVFGVFLVCSAAQAVPPPGWAAEVRQGELQEQRGLVISRVHPQPGSPGRTEGIQHPITPPLHTAGRYIKDSAGRNVTLQCVNWSGGEEKDWVPGGMMVQTSAAIASTIAGWGFNCVRLLWSVEMAANNPVVNPARVPTILSRLPAHPRALDVFDVVVHDITSAGLAVILDNHMSTADWCCSATDGNGLWYTDDWPASSWLNAWQAMAARYVANAMVVGAELRNELRDAVVGGKTLSPTWGSGNEATDWAMAATQAGTLVQKANPNLLVIVDGLQYAVHLEGVRTHPITLPQPHKVVYVAHEYAWFHNNAHSYKDYLREITPIWAYLLLEPEQSWTAPVWVSEFGTPNDGSQMGDNTWWSFVTRFLQEEHVGWGYWRVDGTESNATSRPFNQSTGFGVMDASWHTAAHGGVLLTALQELQ